jgi:transcriptional regulator with XRE-family HTH domain
MIEREGMGRRLREKREQAGMTQTDAAAQVGISRAYLSALEGGHSTPGLKTLTRLADLYRTDLGYLHGGGPQLPPSTLLSMPMPPSTTANRGSVLPTGPKHWVETLRERDTTVPVLLDIWQRLALGQKLKLLAEMQDIVDRSRPGPGEKPADPDQKPE